MIIKEKKLLPLIQDTIAHFESSDAGASLDISANLYQILLLYLKSSQCASKKESTLVKELDPFFNNHISEKITLEMMAEQCHLCPPYFCRRFHVETGMTPMQYLMNKRIESAKYYLLYTNEKLSAIAAALGFYDSNHFSLCFSKIVGTSPSKYRRNSRE